MSFTRPRFKLNNRGISSVVAVILLLAISVSMVTLGSVYVLDLASSSSETAPQTEIEFTTISDTDNKNSTLQVLYMSGERISAENSDRLQLYIDGERRFENDLTADNGIVYSQNNRLIGTANVTGDSTVSVSLVWISPDTGKSEKLSQARVDT